MEGTKQEASPKMAENDDVYTLDNGCPIRSAQGSLRIGHQLQGLQLIRDINLMEIISHLTHERIPERVVHAKGAGAYGEFEVTDADFITKYTDAAFLNTQGKKTPLFARLSTVAGERGSADSVRDGRGFAFKLYTEDGNLDWLFLSTPTFPIRDGAKFPSFAHSQKRDPHLGVVNPSNFWDFNSRNPETFNTLMNVLGPRGTPRSYRHCDIYSVTAYKFTKQLPCTDNTPVPEKYVYVRIWMKTTQKPPLNQSQAEAVQLAGIDPDAFTRDLLGNIQAGNFPTWDVGAQIVEPKDVDALTFDPTKTWPESKVPWHKFGTITLNRNPTDYFEEVEQASFSPASVVPGWDISPDPILQTRLFAYGSAARHRLGTNFRQIPVNTAPGAYNPIKRDGAGYVNRLDPKIQPNYIPANGAPVRPIAARHLALDQESWSGQVTAFQSEITPDDWKQPQEAWDAFSEDEKKEFIGNTVLTLQFATKDVRERVYDCFRNINSDLEKALRKAIGDDKDFTGTSA